jgi:single-strand DNA-binding protein
MSTPVTLRGRLTRDPELRYSAKGTAVVKFAVVTSKSFKNRETDEWEETGTTFWDVVAFSQLAEGCAESLVKGTAVVVTGTAAQEEWTDKEGQKRRTMKVTADDVAPSLRWASAKVSRTDRSRPARTPQADGDPWASGPPPEPPQDDSAPPF